MATEVYTDLNMIQDEDVLRRMWANTEDFGRKKEIRARMYKLREQRLKDFYTAGDVTDMSNRKHQQRPRHAESLEDQGFMTMKSKEIRDSESPTRDISRRKGNGYWDSRQETAYGKGKEEDVNVEVKYISTEGRGVVKEVDMEKKIAYQTESAQESAWKQDDNSFMKSETQNKMSQSASVAKSDNAEERAFAQNEEFSDFKTMSEQKENMSTVSNYSTTSSSRQVTSNSYRSTSDSNQEQRVIVIDDSGTNARPLELSSNLMEDFTDYDVQTDSCTNQSKRESTSKVSTINQSTERVYSSQTPDDSVRLDRTSLRVMGEDVDTGENVKVTEYRTITENQNRNQDQTNKIYRNYEIEESQDRSLEKTVDVSSTVRDSKVEENRSVKSDDFSTSELTQQTRYRTDNARHETVVNEKAVTEQKILNEIQKLDSYLSTHTPAPSTPASPHCEPDGGWTLVSDKDGEFVYHERSKPDDKKAPVVIQPAGKKTSPPSSMDLPTSATDGQYMTTYQQSYNKISVDHSPSHEFFAKTLRSSPERSTPSPTKRDYNTSSSNRSSPERKKLSNSKTSLDKNSSDNRRRAESRSPEYYEKKQRSSPSKSPVQKKKQITPHYESVTSARTNSETRTTTKETKSKRKFSSTKERAVNRNRVATPGTSPSTSPVHKKPSKDTTDSDSDASQATYNCTKKSEVTTESRTNQTTYRKKDKKEQSPEYSSEGSITRELKKKKQTSPEPSAFAPIKQFKTSPQDCAQTDELNYVNSNKLTIENVREHNENNYLSEREPKDFMNDGHDEKDLIQQKEINESKHDVTTNETVTEDIRELRGERDLGILKQTNVQRDKLSADDRLYQQKPTSKPSDGAVSPTETFIIEERRQITVESNSLKSPSKEPEDSHTPPGKTHKYPSASPERQQHEKSPERKQPGDDSQQPEKRPDSKQLGSDDQHPERSSDRKQPGSDRLHPEKGPDRKQPGSDRQHPERSPDRKQPGSDRQHPHRSSDRKQPGSDRQHPERSPDRKQPGSDRQHPQRSPDRKQPGPDRQHPERSPDRKQPGSDSQHLRRSPDRKQPGSDRLHPERSSDRKQPGSDRHHPERSPDRKQPGYDRQHPERSPDRKQPGSDRQHPERSPDRKQPGYDRQHPERSADHNQPGYDLQHPDKSPDRKLPSSDRQHPERSPYHNQPGSDHPDKMITTDNEGRETSLARKYNERSLDHNTGTDQQYEKSPEGEYPDTGFKQPGTDRQHPERSPDPKIPGIVGSHPERSPDRKQPGTVRQHPERNTSPIKKTTLDTIKKTELSVKKVEKRDASDRTTRTKERTTTARQDNFSLTKRTPQKPVFNDAKPRNTSNVPTIKKSTLTNGTPERKSTVLKHTSKVVTTIRSEQNTAPDSLTKRHPESPTVQRKTAPTKQPSQERRVPTSPYRAQTAQPTTIKTTKVSPSRVSKTTTTSVQETTQTLFGRKKGDTTTKKRPSLESNKTETPKPKGSPLRSVSQKSKPVDTNSRLTEKPQTATSQRKIVPAQLKPQSKEIHDTTALTTRETHKTETQNFLKNEAKNVSDLEDETPPDEFYRDMDDEFDSSVQKNVTSTLLSQIKITNEVYDNVRKDQTHKLDSRNSSNLSLEEDISRKGTQSFTNEPTTKANMKQELLNVVVQHPKSSRESSPGYSSTVDNFAVTTSDDGESNPRYADFVSEPEDVEIFDKLTGPSGPIPYTDGVTEDFGEEKDVPKSVAEKVNVFLNEAKKSLETKVTGNQVLIDSSNSVSRAKTLFEKAAKTENTEKQYSPGDSVHHPETKPKSETSYYTQKITEHLEDAVEEEFDLAVNRLPLKAMEETDYRQELKENPKTPRKDTPVPKPPGKTFLRDENNKFIEKESISTKTDVSSKKSFFEKKAEEQKNVQKPKPEPSTYMKKTQASTVRSRSPDKVHKNEQRRKSSVTTEDVSLERRQSKSEVTVKHVTNVHGTTSRFDKNESEKTVTTRRSSKGGERTPSPPKYPDSARQPQRSGSSPTKFYDAKKTDAPQTPKFTKTSENTEQYDLHSTTQNSFETASPRKSDPRADGPSELYDSSRVNDQNKYSPSKVLYENSPKSAEPSHFNQQTYESLTKTKHSTYPHSGEFNTPRHTEPIPSSAKSYDTTRRTEQATFTTSRTYDSPRKSEPRVSSPSKYDAPRKSEPRPSSPSKSYESPRKSDPRASSPTRYYETSRKSEPHASSPSKSYDSPRKSDPRASSPTKSFDTPRKSEPRSTSPSKSYDTPRKSEPRASSPAKYYDSPRKSEPRGTSPSKSYDTPRKSEPRASSPSKYYDSPRKSEPRATSPSKSYDTPRKSEPRASSPSKYYDSPRKSEPRAASPSKSYDSPKKPELRAMSPTKLGIKSYESPLKSENVGEHNVKSYVKTTDSVFRRTSKPDNDSKTPAKSVNDSTLFKQTESVLQKTKTEEKFGVQLRKTPSSNKFDATVTLKLRRSTDEPQEIENIFDLELLEQMLIKAEAYEERRRIRAQIRLVKKELEEQHNTRSTRVQTRAHEVNSHTSSNRDEHTSKRTVKETSPEPKKSSFTKHSFSSQVLKKEEDVEKTAPRRSSPERPKSTYSPDHTTVKTVTTTTTTREKSDSFQTQPPEERSVCTYEIKSKPVDSSFLFRKSSDSSQPDKMSNVKKTTYEKKITTTTSSSTTKTGTDSITSSYGVGPIDEHGKPLFGLRALRRTHQDQSPASDNLARTETVTYTTHTIRTTDLDEPASLASLKTMSKVDREFSGPEIVEVTHDDSALYDDTRRRTSKEYTVEEVSEQNNYTTPGLKSENVKKFTSHLESLQDTQTETGHEEQTRRPLVRGDSVKALQHKFQQATEAANQPCGGSSYPKAGLILRSNSLHHSDDPNQLSSSMKRTKTERVETTRRVMHGSFDGGDGEKQVVVKAQMSEQVEDSSGLKSARQVQGVRAMTTTMTKDGPVEKSASALRVTTSGGGSTTTTTTTSFLDNNDKVTGVQDILSRMRNADLVTETDDTEEDAKARALLNKFLGASVILQGMEQGMKHSGNQQRSAALVGEVDKQLVKATTRTREENIEEICDETQLKSLLDSCSDLEDRRKLRARLREVMAEEKGGVGEAKGSLSGVPGPVEITGIWPSNKGANIDDSGTESGEDLRMINPEIMQEVQTALSRLEGVIPVLDPTKRNAVTQLVSSLQSCLKINKDQQLTPPTPPPRKYGNKRTLKNRHTVGVTREELVEARKWADECGLSRKTSADDINTGQNSFLDTVFRPVRFVPPPVVDEKLPLSKYTKLSLLKGVYQKPILYKIGFFMEPAPQNGTLSYLEPDPKLSYERSLSDTGSLSDYDPSLGLFTPEQSVQIAVHKAAINKQISCRENTKVQGRGSSEEGDVSSADEDKHELSSVHRLLQLASESKPKFTGKKQKMKRANTIDIPKRSNIFDYSSDDHGASADEQNRKGSDDMGHLGKKDRPPSFEPKTENDHKFLSFLQRVSESEGSKMPAYNPSARGGKHWQNRFSTIKTTFESKDFTPPKTTFSPSPAKLFWQKSESQNLKENKTNSNMGKLPWSVKTQEDGVIVGSLTVAKPSIVNHFNHAPKSAFKPIEKKPTTLLISPASGSVKQIAAMKFSTFETPIVQKPKPVTMKIYANDTDKGKNKFLANNDNNSNVTHKFYNIPSNVVSHEVKQKIQEKHNHINNQSSKPKYKQHEPVTNNAQVEKNCFYPGQSAKKPGQKEIVKAQPAFLPQPGNQYSSSLTKSSGIAPFANSINNQTLSRLPGSVLTEPRKPELIPQIREDCDKVYQSNGKNQYFECASMPKEPPNKLSSTFYNGEEINKPKPRPLPYPNKVMVKVEEEDVDINKNSRQSRIYEEKDLLKYIPNGNDLSHPITETAPKLNGYSNFIKPENNPPINNTNFIHEDKPLDNCSYLCNLRDASTIDTDREYVSNIPATKTILKNGQFVSITPKSRTPTIDGEGVNEFNKLSPNISGGRSPINQSSPPTNDGLSNGGRVYYNNTQMRLSNKMEDMNQMENYLNARLANQHSALSPHNLPVSPTDRVSPLRNWAPASSPYIRVEESDDRVNGDDCYEERAVSRVMGQAQCQVAVSVNNRNRTRYDDGKNIESDLKLQVQQSARQKSLSPTNFPNVLQKSESWHQMVIEKMNKAKQAPPLPKLSKAKSSHSLALPRQFETAISPETVENKKMTVSQYLSKQSSHREKRRGAHLASKSMLDLDDLENVDEVFESIFQEANKKRNKHTDFEQTEGDGFSTAKVHTRVSSSTAKLTKANSVQSPFAKFKQLERQNSAPSCGRTLRLTEPRLPTSASTIKERLLGWVQAQTREYKNVQIDNFSTSWSDGLAFCALIHHFCPDAFDYNILTPDKRRYNFELAFRIAEEKADIYPLLDVEDMVTMSKPDWKCVFTYVQSIYQKLHDSPLSVPTNPYL